MKLTENENNDGKNVLLFIFNYRKILAFSIIFGALVSFCVSKFFIPERFLSYGIIFPTNSNNPISTLEDPKFGQLLEADQLNQLLESETIKDKIIEKFNLIDYYELDTTDLDWEAELTEEYYKDIVIEKSKYMSVIVSAHTKNPQLSADIVNSIIEEGDLFRENIFKSNQLDAYKSIESEFVKQSKLVDSLKSEIYQLKDASKAENIIYNHIERFKEQKIDDKNLYITSPELEKLIYDYEFEFNRLKYLKGDFQRAELNLNRPFSKTYTISKAKPNFKKHSPKNLLNAAIGAAISLIFAIAYIILKKRWFEISAMLKA